MDFFGQNYIKAVQTTGKTAGQKSVWWAFYFAIFTHDTPLNKLLNLSVPSLYSSCISGMLITLQPVIFNTHKGHR